MEDNSLLVHELEHRVLGYGVPGSFGLEGEVVSHAAALLIP